MKNSISFRRALYIAATYLILGVLWIYFSDNLLLNLFPESIIKITSFQTYKGWLFVIFTAFLIFFLTYAALDITERKRFEEALRTSKERFRDLVNLLPQTIYEADMEGNITFVNSTGLSIFGVIAEDIDGKTNIRDFVAPNDRERGIDNLQKILQGEMTAPNEDTMLRKDGSTFPAIIYSSPIIRGDKTIGIRGLVIDIAERKRAEEALLKSGERTRYALDVASDGVRDWNIKTGKVIYSDKWCKSLGYEPDEVAGNISFWEEILHPDDKENTLKKVDEHFEKKSETYSYENRLRKKSGEYRHNLERGRVVEWDKDGKPLRMIGTDTDITERKQIELELRESEERYRLAFNQQFQFMIILSPEGHVIEINDLPLKIQGSNRKDVVGKPFWQSPAWKNLPEWQEIIKNRIKQITSMKEPLFVEDMFQTASGEIHYVDATYLAVRESDDSVHSILVQATDITKRKQVEEALYESENKYRTLFEKSADAILIIERTKFVDCNQATLKMLGYKNKKDLIGTHPAEISPEIQPDGRNSFEKQNEILSTVYDHSSIRFEWDHTRQNGKIFPVEVLLTPVPLGERNFIHCVWRDITERKHAEKLLENRLCQQIKIVDLGQHALSGELLFDLMNKVVKDVAEVLDIEYCNVLELTPERDGLLLRSGGGWQEGLVGQAIVDSSSNSQAGYTLLSHEPVVVEDLRTEKRFSGSSLLIDHGVISGMSVIIGKPDRPYGVLGVHSTEKRLFTESDINFLQAVAHVLSSAIESKHANDQILQSREQLRNLASELQIAREEERTRISREIHDELGQNLTGLRIDLKWMLDQLPKKNKDLADRAQIALLLADKTLDSVQKLSQELRPSVLDDLGLEPAIKWQINEFIHYTTCHCNLEMNIGDLDINDKRDTNVFRVLQEALTNIMRHAEASQVNVSLQTTNGRMLLEISDNGRGITTDKLDSSNSIGLIGMRERAIELGGRIAIQCQQSGGTLVQLDIPLQRH